MENRSTYIWGARVRVIDPESPWFGRTGVIEQQTAHGILVRFPGSLMQLNSDQLEGHS